MNDVLTDNERETRRLLTALADARRARQVYSDAAIRAQTVADDAASDVGRWRQAYKAHVEKLCQEAT